MSKIVKILTKVLSLVFVFAMLTGGVSASAADEFKGRLSNDQLTFRNPTLGLTNN